MPRVVIATKNSDKIREIEAVLAGLMPDLVTERDLEWPDVEETGSTLEENALIKARSVAAVTGFWSIGDDTGLEVAALDGAPGVRSARFAGPAASYAENRAALLQRLQGVNERKARFRTAVALVVPGGREIVVSGNLDGEITFSERGGGGFGYDSVFEVDGVTLAEMGEEAKNRISHRARALAALVGVLESVGNDLP